MEVDITSITTDDTSSFVVGYKLSDNAIAVNNPMLPSTFNVIRNFFMICYFAGRIVPVSFLPLLLKLR
ncbi:hypothetical protein IX307_001401 [Bacteroides pyogenes]|nr:hypothetical protein [Bacteroides pyogenes]MBR8726006.1 hypothetical protein [Bacteroides pyogenes]MBR8739286.1 hypothetical protein [Bacteroides pyogenes]MBR8755164.1 hypothetical protein [Bacteroides pyogenes]MBR8787080.1 hypothetical protein [Bacteroides pyogenes]